MIESVILADESGIHLYPYAMEVSKWTLPTANDLSLARYSCANEDLRYYLIMIHHKNWQYRTDLQHEVQPSSNGLAQTFMRRRVYWLPPLCLLDVGG